MQGYLWTFSFKRFNQREPLDLWIPVPQQNYYQNTKERNSQTNGLAQRLHNFDWNFDFIHIHFDTLQEPLHFDIQYELHVKERTWNDHPVEISKSDLDFYLQSRPHVPITPYVRLRAHEIIQGAKRNIEKAKKIYDWILYHGERDPNQIGCGLGNVIESLENNHICGRCVDISSVAVALLRGAGVPARELFGIRLGPSSWAQKLGRLGDQSESFHCKVEFYVEEGYWNVMDPGDALKVALDEQLSSTSRRFQEAAERLFGSAEANWAAFNSLRDTPLSPHTGQIENYFMYPIGLSLDERLNPYDPMNFTYQITTEDLTNS